MTIGRRIGRVLWGFLIVSSGMTSVAFAQTLVLDDPLQGSTTGTRTGPIGGAFVTGGWQVKDHYDGIYWHLPYTVTNGEFEFKVKGLTLACTLGEEKNELSHMYDWTYNNADTNYTGYRNSPFKQFIRKQYRTNNYGKLELLWQVTVSGSTTCLEQNSAVLSWDPSLTYTFKVKWYPSNGGASVTIDYYRDGVKVYSQTLAGSWNPTGHSVRIAASPRRANEGAPVDAIFSYVKVWDCGGPPTPPAAPTVILPAKGTIISTPTPTIRWAGEAHTQYRVRVNTSNDPNTGIAWDSGDVASSADYATPATLSDGTTYYVFVKLANAQGWGAWSANGYLFVINTSYQRVSGRVLLSTNSLTDNNGAFLGLGATYMQALRRCKYDRTQFRKDLSYLSSNGFNYIRILSMVGYGGCYWGSLEIVPIGFTNDKGTWLPAWTDYWQQLQDLVDIVYDEYGMRTQITIFADAQDISTSDRQAHADSILAHLVGREHKIILLEVANEHWKNGFPINEGGVAEVRSLGQRMADYMANPAKGCQVMLLALSATWAEDEAALQEMYSGSAATIATEHFTRNTTTSEGDWLPIRDCWYAAAAAGVPPCSNNEPIGPGSSTAEQTDPLKLVTHAAFSWIAKLPSYVYHANAGVRGWYGKETCCLSALIRFEDMAGSTSYKTLLHLLPGDLANWTRNDGIESAAPFTVFADGQANKYWPDVPPGATTGVDRNIGGIKGSEFVTLPMGVLSGGATLQARQKMAFEVFHPLTGGIVMSRLLEAGQQITLTNSAAAYIIRGVLLSAPMTQITTTLGRVDTRSGLFHTIPFNGDGDTETMIKGTKHCRVNKDPAEDFYFYFGANDGYAYQGSRPDEYITIEYYDTGSGSLLLQYDGSASAYTNGGSVSLTNSGTWKNYTFHVTDAYFGNRQNGGADFRIAKIGGLFYLRTVTVTYVPPTPPAIELNPTSLTRSVMETQNLPNDTFTVRNSGGGTLNYTMADNVSWLSVAPESGNSTGESDTITITYSTAALTPGPYTGTITVTDPAASNSPRTLIVSLTVTSKPIIQLSVSSFNRAMIKGRTVPNDTFTITNGGGTVLNYTITKNVSWLSVSPTGGSLNPGQTSGNITVSYPGAPSLVSGTYPGTITVTDPNASNSPQTIGVSLTVQGSGDLDNDNDVDQTDFGMFQRCLSGYLMPYAVGCEDADLDGDGDVDTTDFAQFQTCMGGPNQPLKC